MATRRRCARALNISVISRHLFLLITISRPIFANYESQHDLMGSLRQTERRGGGGAEAGGWAAPRRRSDAVEAKQRQTSSETVKRRTGDADPQQGIISAADGQFYRLMSLTMPPPRGDGGKMIRWK